jgi:glycosyltransferase involved in cell wall biosynthesis
MLDQITPLILTFNEAPNIARTLSRLAWAREVVVVDSFSTDGTAEIVAAHPNARLVQHKFDCHADQWNFGLQASGIDTEWVLALDADFFVPDALEREISALDPDDDVDGYQVPFKYCIEGRPLRNTVYPPVTVLFRRNRGCYVQDGHTQRIRLLGKVLKLTNPIFHDDRKSLQRWFSSQIRYMRLEAAKLLEVRFSALPLRDRVRRLIVVAPAAMFFYCLVVKGNILDGRAGIFYALQRAVAEGILSVFLLQALMVAKSLPDRR